MSLDQNGFLSEDELLEFDDIREEDVVVPEWGNKKVRIRALTLEQMAVLATRVTRRDPRTNTDTIDRELSMALTLQYGMVNPKIKPENVGRLKAKSAAAVTRIVQAINALGATEETINEAAKSNEAELNGSVSVFPGARIGEDPVRVGAVDVPE